METMRYAAPERPPGTGIQAAGDAATNIDLNNISTFSGERDPHSVLSISYDDLHDKFTTKEAVDVANLDGQYESRSHSNGDFGGGKAVTPQWQGYKVDDIELEHWHYSHRSPWLRALLLGANDGLVSIASLMLGVGAVKNDIKSMVISGLAGLVAGAGSMAIGEYVSVNSQRDTELVKS
jgi:hypothetical protein